MESLGDKLRAASQMYSCVEDFLSDVESLLLAEAELGHTSATFRGDLLAPCEVDCRGVHVQSYFTGKSTWEKMKGIYGRLESREVEVVVSWSTTPPASEPAPEESEDYKAYLNAKPLLRHGAWVVFQYGKLVFESPDQQELGHFLDTIEDLYYITRVGFEDEVAEIG